MTVDLDMPALLDAAVHGFLGGGDRYILTRRADTDVAAAIRQRVGVMTRRRP